MLENATRICDAPHGTIYLREGDVATIVAHFGPLQSTPIGQQTPLESGWVTGRTIRDAQTIHVADIATSDEFPLGARTLAAAWQSSDPRRPPAP